MAPATDAAGAGVLLSEPDVAAALLPRCGVREPGVVDDDRDGPGSEEAFDPLDPAEPELSANAAGIDATPAPTPRAKANAPIRPT